MTSQLRRLDTRRLPALSPDGVDAYLVVRNEIDRLPEILDHHRRLGVERFFVTDNGSDDGTPEYLLAQPDCVVHHTTASFGAARWGMDWINELAASHGQDRWRLFIDADELFVYPHADTVTLPELCRFLSDTGAEGVFALMVDMYGPGPLVEAVHKPGMRLLDVCPLHDTRYTVRRKPGLPFARHFCNVEALGGPRQRIFYPEFNDVGVTGMVAARALRKLRHSRFGGPLGLTRSRLGICPPDITKIPLVRGAAGRHWVSNHRTTPLTLSPVTGALLHFKLLSTFAEKAAVEARRGEHWGGGTEYARYAALLTERADVRFAYADSRRYRTPHDLVREGIMRSSQAFDAFADSVREAATGAAARFPQPGELSL